MKHLLLLTFVFALIGMAKAQDQAPIIIETQHTALVYKTDRQNKLTQVYFGEKLSHTDEYNKMFSRSEAYVPAGMENLNEPAIRIVHNDNNPSLTLKFDKTEQTSQSDNVKTTIIYLKDDVYPVQVKLFFKSFYGILKILL